MPFDFVNLPAPVVQCFCYSGSENLSNPAEFNQTQKAVMQRLAFQTGNDINRS